MDQARRKKDLERETVRLRRLVADLSLEKQVLADVDSGNFQAQLRDAGRRWTASGRGTASSEPHACRLVGRPRGTRRDVPTLPADEDALTRSIVALASGCGRHGYRRITAPLRAAGWQVGKDRVQRVRPRQG